MRRYKPAGGDECEDSSSEELDSDNEDQACGSNQVNRRTQKSRKTSIGDTAAPSDATSVTSASFNADHARDVDLLTDNRNISSPFPTPTPTESSLSLSSPAQSTPNIQVPDPSQASQGLGAAVWSGWSNTEWGPGSMGNALGEGMGMLGSGNGQMMNDPSRGMVGDGSRAIMGVGNGGLMDVGNGCGDMMGSGISGLMDTGMGMNIMGNIPDYNLGPTGRNDYFDSSE